MRVESTLVFIAWELRPAALDQFGLALAAEKFVAVCARHYGIPAEFSAVGLGGQRLKPEVETNLYRILREALQNVHKHAGATHVSLLLEQRDGRAALKVEDNGEGYDPEASLPPLHQYLPNTPRAPWGFRA